MKKSAKQTKEVEVAEIETEEISELKQKIWAVIDESGCRISGVTYAEAKAAVEKKDGTIVTSEAASRTS